MGQFQLEDNIWVGDCLQRDRQLEDEDSCKSESLSYLNTSLTAYCDDDQNIISVCILVKIMHLIGKRKEFTNNYSLTFSTFHHFHYFEHEYIVLVACQVEIGWLKVLQHAETGGFIVIQYESPSLQSLWHLQ